MKKSESEFQRAFDAKAYPYKIQFQQWLPHRSAHRRYAYTFNGRPFESTVPSSPGKSSSWKEIGYNAARFAVYRHAKEINR